MNGNGSPETGLAPRAGATVFDLIDNNKAEIAKALPRLVNIDQLVRAFLSECRRVPKLMQCTASSLYQAFLDMSQTGLEPGPAGLVYLIPYGKECQFQISYKGLMVLARRSDEISTFSAHVVYERDTFSYRLGLNPDILHIPYDGEDDPGKMLYAYAIVRMKDGGVQFRVLSRREVLKARDASPANRKGKSPWNGPFESEMWLKTALKRVCKLCPISIEMMHAIGRDDLFEAGVVEPVNLNAPNGTKAKMGFPAKAKVAPPPGPPPKDLADQPNAYEPVPEGELVEGATP
jgi:recombination protein RecT